jgi:hypothetical protein
MIIKGLGGTKIEQVGAKLTLGTAYVPAGLANARSDLRSCVADAETAGG